jgi:hypothetical protein
MSGAPSASGGVPYARSRICPNSVRNKLRTLRDTWPDGIRSDFTTANPDAAEAFNASLAGPLTSGLIESIQFEIADRMFGQIDLISSVRLNSIITNALAAVSYPSAYLAAPVRVTVYKVYVSNSGVITLAPTTGAGAFTPVSQLVPRVWYNPTLNTGGVFPHDTVSASTLSLTLGPGIYVATQTLETDGTPASEYWVSAVLSALGVSGWNRAGFTNPFSIALAANPPLLQIRGTMLFASGTPSRNDGPPEAATNKEYLCVAASCTEVAAGGVTLPTCLSTC